MMKELLEVLMGFIELIGMLAVYGAGLGFVFVVAVTIIKAFL